MAQIIVRNLDKTLKEKIQVQASLKGVSMEEEVRQILSNSFEDKFSKTGEIIASYFEECGFDDLELQKLEARELRSPSFED